MAVFYSKLGAETMPYNYEWIKLRKIQKLKRFLFLSIYKCLKIEIRSNWLYNFTISQSYVFKRDEEGV